MLSMVVTLDVSQLSGWLNSVASCRLERRAYDAGRHAGQKLGGRGAAAEGGPRAAETAGWARAERTRNIRNMFVTLDVSQLVSGWLNAGVFCRVERDAYEKRGSM